MTRVALYARYSSEGQRVEKGTRTYQEDGSRRTCRVFLGNYPLFRSMSFLYISWLLLPSFSLFLSCTAPPNFGQVVAYC